MAACGRQFMTGPGRPLATPMKTTPLRTSFVRTGIVAMVLAGAALVSAEWDRRTSDAPTHLAQADRQTTAAFGR
jgi:hypothetical protein